MLAGLASPQLAVASFFGMAVHLVAPLRKVTRLLFRRGAARTTRTEAAAPCRCAIPVLGRPEPVTTHPMNSANDSVWPGGFPNSSGGSSRRGRGRCDLCGGRGASEIRRPPTAPLPGETGQAPTRTAARQPLAGKSGYWFTTYLESANWSWYGPCSGSAQPARFRATDRPAPRGGNEDKGLRLACSFPVRSCT